MDWLSSTCASSILSFFSASQKPKLQQISNNISICPGSEMCHSGLWSQAINLAPTRPCVSHVIPPCLIGGNSLYRDHLWTRNPPRKLQFCLLTLLPFCSSLLYRNVHFVFQCFSVLSDFPIYFTYNHYDVFSAG